MLPDIGMIVAVYTVTRLIAILASKAEPIIARILAVPAILVTALFTYDLVAGHSGSSSSPFAMPTP